MTQRTHVNYKSLVEKPIYFNQIVFNLELQGHHYFMLLLIALVWRYRFLKMNKKDRNKNLKNEFFFSKYTI